MVWNIKPGLLRNGLTGKNGKNLIHICYSHIPGTIMHIEVKEGQIVEEGDTLLILQAMKMNNKLSAPFSGKIKKISVSVGDKIPKGALMVEMEESEAE